MFRVVFTFACALNMGKFVIVCVFYCYLTLQQLCFSHFSLHFERNLEITFAVIGIYT